MVEAIRNDNTPNFYFMHYDLESWQIQNLLLIPSFAFSESAIIKRNPLAPTARRAGWIGCNISLNNIPAEARIYVVRDRQVVAANEVRQKFLHIKPLKDIAASQRGWTLDVLNAIRLLGKIEFTTDDAYKLVPHLERLHPKNRHVRAKIRQQLQVLRDSELLIHIERSLWRIP
jgi:type II restriction enzyme